MSKSKTITIKAVTTFKHGALCDALEKFGTQAKLAEHLQVEQSQISKWIRLESCPPRTANKYWTDERIKDVEKKLFAITGKTLDEIFPDELRNNSIFLSAKKTAEANIELNTSALLEYGQATAKRIAYKGQYAITTENEMKERIAQCLEMLPDKRMIEIVKMRYGIQPFEEMTLEQVSEKLDISTERVRQIEAKAVRLMQQPAITSKLVEYAG